MDFETGVRSMQENTRPYYEFLAQFPRHRLLRFPKSPLARELKQVHLICHFETA